MFHFAHPAHCPQCRAARGDAPRCPRCGLLVVGAGAERLYALLAQADEVLDALRSESARGSTVRPGVPEPPGSGVAVPEPGGSPPPVRAPRRLSTGSVLLALGALLLVVAGAVFVAVAWGSLSLSARTLILLGVTVLLAAATVGCLRRQLRASTETLWSVTALLLLIDVLAAGATGLPVVGDLEPAGLLTVAAAVVGLPSVAAAALARRTWDPPLAGTLVAAEVAVGAAALLGAAAMVDAWPRDDRWLPLALLALFVGVGAVIRTAGLATAATVVSVLAVGAYALAAASSVSAVAEHPRLGRVVDGPLWPALVVVAVSAAACWWLRWSTGLQLAAALVGVGVLAALVLLPAEQAGTVPGVVATCAFALALGAVGILPAVGAVLAARLAGALLVAGLSVLVLGLLAVGALALVDLVEDPWTATAGVRLTGTAVDDPWLGLVVGGTLAVVALLAARWEWPGEWSGAWSAWPAGRPGDWPARTLPAADLPPADLPPADLPPTDHPTTDHPTTDLPTDDPTAWGRAVLVVAAPVALLLGALGWLLAVETPAWVLTAAGVVAAGAAAGARLALVLAPAVVTVLVAVGASAASLTLSAYALLSAGLALVAAGFGARRDRLAVPLVGTGLPVGVTGAVAAVGALGAEGDLAALVVVLVAAVLAQGAAYAIWVWRRGWLHVAEGAEVAAALAVPVSVLLAGDDATRTSVSLTVLGVAATGTGVLRTDRASARWVGLALLQTAWTIRLLSTDVETVEVYTLPAALVLLGAGLWTVRANGAVRTWTAVLPGLSLAVLPSLPQALVDPTSVRAWLVGAAGLVLVAAGVRLSWAAPLAVGGAAVGVLGVAHLASAAAAVPRWAVLAAAGAALVGAGFTWEARVRDAQALASYVGDLR